MKNIYLTGFMGCGKSTIGAVLAHISGRNFFDLDNFITEKEHLPIAEIFQKYGETYFRELETQYLTLLSQKKNAVISLGGGTILNDINAEICKKTGKTVLLIVDFETSYERIKSTKRPLVMNNTREQVNTLYNNRLPLYIKNSDFSVEAFDSPFSVARIIKKFCR
jgi:shikimate kinase